jgi:hypothetical protein
VRYIPDVLSGFRFSSYFGYPKYLLSLVHIATVLKVSKVYFWYYWDPRGCQEFDTWNSSVKTAARDGRLALGVGLRTPQAVSQSSESIRRYRLRRGDVLLARDAGFLADNGD